MGDRVKESRVPVFAHNSQMYGLTNGLISAKLPDQSLGNSNTDREGFEIQNDSKRLLQPGYFSHKLSQRAKDLSLAEVSTGEKMDL